MILQEEKIFLKIENVNIHKILIQGSHSTLITPVTSVADPFHFDMDLDPAPNPTLNREIINFCFTFFYYKKYFSKI